MAQSVVYADLKFATGPSSTVPDEDDSPYENVPLGPAAAAPSAGRWTRRWRVPTALLAASLLLLLLLFVAVVALGACHWQVTRSLQDSSREHASEQGRLTQELRVREQSLEQIQLELAWAREELQRAWHEGNISQLQLKSSNAELGHTQQELAVLREEMHVVQWKLNNSERTVSSLLACINTVTNKTWEQSWEDCAERLARLMVQDNWTPLTVPYFMHASKAHYWIGGKTRRSEWMDNKPPLKRHTNCWSVINGEMWSKNCDNAYQWICEKSPKLSSASETQSLF